MRRAMSAADIVAWSAPAFLDSRSFCIAAILARILRRFARMDCSLASRSALFGLAAGAGATEAGFAGPASRDANWESSDAVFLSSDCRHAAARLVKTR